MIQQGVFEEPGDHLVSCGRVMHVVKEEVLGLDVAFGQQRQQVDGPDALGLKKAQQLPVEGVVAIGAIRIELCRERRKDDNELRALGMHELRHVCEETFRELTS